MHLSFVFPNFSSKQRTSYQHGAKNSKHTHFTDTDLKHLFSNLEYRRRMWQQRKNLWTVILRPKTEVSEKLNKMNLVEILTIQD